MTDNNQQRINEIDGALMGKWTTENKNISFFFLPLGKIVGKGQVEVGDGDLFVSDTLEYQVSIDNNNPFITVFNPKTNQTKRYKILLIDTREKVLNLLTETDKELNFRQG